MSTKPAILYSFQSTPDLVTALADYIIDAQKDVLDPKSEDGKGKDKFTVAISGGSLPKQLSGLVSNPAVDWKKWHIYYADERCVPLDHEDSNHKLCNDNLYSKIKQVEGKNNYPKIYHIDEKLISELADIRDDPEKVDEKLEEIAESYQDQLIQEFGHENAAPWPVFDLILLGIGPDGHTCSLFPGHRLLADDDDKKWVAHVVDSPKPPPMRITLTLHSVNHASRVAFVATGEGKVDILPKILDTPEEGLPASRVVTARGQVAWFVDDPASAKVKYTKSSYHHKERRGSL